MSYEITCEKCNYESSCNVLPKGYNLKRCPKCGAQLRFWFNYWTVPALYRGDVLKRPQTKKAPMNNKGGLNVGNEGK